MENNGNSPLSQHSMQQSSILLVMLWLTPISCINRPVIHFYRKRKNWKRDQTWAKKNRLVQLTRGWTACAWICVFVLQWSWWLYWERWPSPPGPADHWPAGRTFSSQRWWLMDHKKKSSGNSSKSESIFSFVKHEPHVKGHSGSKEVRCYGWWLIVLLARLE